MVHMMVTIGIYLRRWQRVLRRWLSDPRARAGSQATLLLLTGFCLSAASLRNSCLSLTLGLLCGLAGWPAVLITGGGMLGYWVFWGSAGLQGIAWLCAALPAALLLNRRQLTRDGVWILPVLAGVIVAGMGLLFQVWLGDQTPVLIYLLRIVLAIVSARLFASLTERRDPVAEWLAGAVGVLALAQICPVPYFGLGYIAAGLLCGVGAFPAAALAGLALDLAGITPVPMTAALAVGYLIRLIPGVPKWALCCAGGMGCLAVMYFCGVWDMQPLPGLVLGSVIALSLPPRTDIPRRRSETGFAQVRLELASAVLRQTEQLLLDVSDPPIDEEALVARAAERACGSCRFRKVCKETPGKLPARYLHMPLGNGDGLPVTCRRSGRLLQELRRSQEQLRAIRSDRDRREEYRAAVAQQYHFLSAYLQDMSDALSRRAAPARQSFQPEVAVCASSRERHNGDRCFWFAGVESRYYILLCDGMGTGEEAARDGKAAGQMLKRMLSAGYPPEYALRSINSLCALQGRAGAVTVDLAELQLDTGKAAVYKWGAAPSYVLYRGEPIKIGTAGPPPGLSVTDGRETVERLSLRRGELLILLSDGAGGEDSLRGALEGEGEAPGELAARILEHSQRTGTDDATVAVVRMNSLG